MGCRCFEVGWVSTASEVRSKCPVAVGNLKSAGPTRSLLRRYGTSASLSARSTTRWKPRKLIPPFSENDIVTSGYSLSHFVVQTPVSSVQREKEEGALSRPAPRLQDEDHQAITAILDHHCVCGSGGRTIQHALRTLGYASSPTTIEARAFLLIFYALTSFSNPFHMYFLPDCANSVSLLFFFAHKASPS